MLISCTFFSYIFLVDLLPQALQEKDLLAEPFLLCARLPLPVHIADGWGELVMPRSA